MYDATILQYIDILQYLLLQYNTICLIKILIRILLIVIYCDILQYIATLIAFKAVSIRLLHYKNDWTSCNHKYTVQFLAILHVST